MQSRKCWTKFRFINTLKKSMEMQILVIIRLYSKVIILKSLSSNQLFTSVFRSFKQAGDKKKHNKMNGFAKSPLTHRNPYSVRLF